MNAYHMKSSPRWVVSILLLFQLAGCNQEQSCHHTWRAGAALAIAEAEQAIAAKTSGWPGVEGEARTPGSVSESVGDPREPPNHDERNRRILYFGADYCATCRIAEESLDALSQAGWQVGPEPSNHIQTFTLDETEEEHAFARQWDVNSVPTWILWENGREVKRGAGPLDPFEIGRLFKLEKSIER